MEISFENDEAETLFYIARRKRRMGEPPAGPSAPRPCAAWCPRRGTRWMCEGEYTPGRDLVGEVHTAEDQTPQKCMAIRLLGRLSAARVGLAAASRERLARPCDRLDYEHVPERNACRASRIDAAGRRSEKSLQDRCKLDRKRPTAILQRRPGERRENSVTLALSLDTSGSNSVVESRLPKPLVAGSIPVSRSTFNSLPLR